MSVKDELMRITGEQLWATHSVTSCLGLIITGIGALQHDMTLTLLGIALLYFATERRKMTGVRPPDQWFDTEENDNQ